MVPTFFCDIRILCGGWIRTEEEIELRNHLNWARVKVRGDGDSVSKLVVLAHEGLTFKVPIWVEMLTMVVTNERSKVPPKTHGLRKESMDYKIIAFWGSTSLYGLIRTTSNLPKNLVLISRGAKRKQQRYS